MSLKWNSTPKLWIAAIASTLAVFMSLVPFALGIIFASSLIHYPIILMMTYASPLATVSAYIAFQVKPNKLTALYTLFSILLVIATWCIWLSDSADGIIH